MTLRLGFFYPNNPTAQVLAPEIINTLPSVMDYDLHTKLATTLERVGFDYAFLADSWGSFGPHSRAGGYQDPMILPPLLAMHLMGVTKHLRCIATMHTSFLHPLLIVRMLKALDAFSKGRCGVNIVAGSGFGDGLDKQVFGSLNPDQRYDRAIEAIEILLKAWNDTRIAFEGKYFQIDGEMVGPRAPATSRPFIVSAGASDAGRVLAGRYADINFMPGRTPQEELKRRMSDIQRIAGEFGRPKGAVRLQIHASIVARETEAEAKEYSDWIASKVDLNLVTEYLNVIRGNISTYDDVYRMLGELQMRQVGTVGGSRKIHGSAEYVADQIEMLHREYGCDGLAVTFPVWSVEEIERFGKLVIPRLKAKGIWVPPAEHDYSW
ncbi:Nitrilotriacetate monooxygenase component A [subsurface metagenome]